MQQREYFDGRVMNWAHHGCPPMNRCPVAGYGGSPWAYNKVYDSRAIIALHKEVNDFYEYMSPTPEEHTMRETIVKNIEEIILELWPSARVEVFGSFRTGLYLPTSDIDLVVIGDWAKIPLRTLEEALLQKRVCDLNNIRVIDKAAVPIVKLTESWSQVKIDISFNTNNGLQSAELIKEYKKKYPALGKLVLVLKQFLFQRDLNEVFHGGVSSYSLILMTVSFLQLHPRANVNNLDANLGVLLIEFFELYGRKFNYIATGIRTRKGGSYFSKQQTAKDFKEGQRCSALCIEDPLNPGNDIARGSFEVLQVRQAFEFGYITLTQLVNPLNRSDRPQSLLGRIVSVSDSLVDYRWWISSNFSFSGMSRLVSPTPSGASLSSISSGSFTGENEERSITIQKNNKPSKAGPVRPQTSKQFISQNGFVRTFKNGKRRSKNMSY